jgi:hypothetical protein
MKAQRLFPAAALLLALSQTGCIIVGGYTSRGGWFIWPGLLGILLLLVLMLFATSLFRR